MFLREVLALFTRNRKQKTLVIGAGNPWRGDDGAGLFLLALLAREVSRPRLSYLPVERNPENFVDVMKKNRPEVVILFDAARFGGRSGEIRLLDRAGRLPLRSSTHTYDLALFLSYLKKSLGCQVYTAGIQGERFELLNRRLRISRPVRESIHEFVRAVKSEPAG